MYHSGLAGVQTQTDQAELSTSRAECRVCLFPCLSRPNSDDLMGDVATDTVRRMWGEVSDDLFTNEYVSAEAGVI